jgi:transposase
MPWKVTEPMCERAKFVTLHEQGLFSMSELCQRFGISRRTGYKWLDRFQQSGLDGLKDQSRKPHSSPRQTCLEVQEALRQVRRDHPTWGPKKLLAYLQPRRPDLSCPQRPVPWARCSNSTA